MLMTWRVRHDKNKQGTPMLGASAMPDFPRSLIAFQRRFADEAACAAYLAAIRWPDGFRCPACGHDRAWRLETKSWTY